MSEQPDAGTIGDMPNWCENLITISGPAAALEDIAAVFDTSGWILGAPGLDAYTEDSVEVRLSKWGTGRADTARFYLDGDERFYPWGDNPIPGTGQITLGFDTAWSPSDLATQAWSGRHPEVSFVHTWAEPGVAVRGRIECRGGDTVDEIELNIPELPEWTQHTWYGPEPGHSYLDWKSRIGGPDAHTHRTVGEVPYGTIDETLSEADRWYLHRFDDDLGDILGQAAEDFLADALDAVAWFDDGDRSQVRRMLAVNIEMSLCEAVDVVSQIRGVEDRHHSTTDTPMYSDD